MNILEKIDRLRTERNWTIYKLAEESGVQQSTLSNMFSRKTLPSITTLINLCDAFKISLSEFFAEKKEDIEKLEEHSLIENYRKLSAKNKNVVKNLIDDLL